MIDQKDFNVQNLGECTIDSPMKGIRFTEDSNHILFHRELNAIQSYLDKGDSPPVFEAAAPGRRCSLIPQISPVEL